MDLGPAALIRLARDAPQKARFFRAARRFAKDTDATLRDPDALAELVRLWVNPYSARPSYLKACSQAALRTDGPILECGSGLTTVLIGLLAGKRGRTVWTLEHDPRWAAKTRRHLLLLGVRSVHLECRPLRDYGDYDWYDPPLASMPRFSLVLCDGPPGSTRGGRYGLVPVMRTRLSPGCTILLDDVAREGERTIARRWVDELGATYEFRDGDRPYAELRLPGGPPRSIGVRTASE